MRRARKFIRKINPSVYEPDVDLEQIETVVPRGISLRGLADNLGDVARPVVAQVFSRDEMA